LTRPFDAAARERALAGLPTSSYDLIVIGAGITGAGVAALAAHRGWRVLVVDAGDIAAATSSRSSRLIHGGLRYLENRDFRLVFEALAERRALLRLAPHLVRPLRFLFPVWRGGPVGYRKLQAGMWLYDSLALYRGVGRHRMLRRRALLADEPGLQPVGLRGGAAYYDAAVDDARLTLAVARRAHERGCDLVTHARVEALSQEGQQVTGVDLLDLRSGARHQARGRVVVNAAGPWSDAVRRLYDPAAVSRLRPTKGVHILVPRARLGNRHAVIFPSPVDGRIMFVLPWGRFAYVGTTDTDVEGDPGDAGADGDDVRYLLDSANGLFPGADLTESDVHSTWTGVRPMLAGHADVPAGATSREHEVWREAQTLVNVAGGKLTTFRVMARDVMREAERVLGPPPADRQDDEPLPGAPPAGEEELLRRLHEHTGASGMPREELERLAARLGSDAPSVLQLMADDPELRRPLVAELPYTAAELVFAARQEMVVTLEDALRRRIGIFYEARDGGAAAADEAAAVLGRELGWSPEARVAEVESYRAAAAAVRTWESSAAGSGVNR
jgi:glycerol-3-phosphate dehydrogenase